MNLSQKGLDLIKRFEGLRLVAYKVVPTEKHYTIGYGHYGQDVKASMRITEERAEELLKQDVSSFVNGVNQCVKVRLNQNQFDALVSFTYNVGIGALIKSTLLEKLNQGDYKGASNEFPRWNKSGGRVLNGLVTRRKVEKELFDLTPYTDKIFIPNTATWQCDTLVKEYTEKGFYCYGVPVDPNKTGKDDGCIFTVEVENMQKANQLKMELEKRGYSKTIWVTI